MGDKKNKSERKTVLITGTTSGFGLYLVRAFLNAGFVVIAHGKDGKKLKSIKNELPKVKRGCLITVEGDLQEFKGLDKVASSLSKNNVDILVNNAAINPELREEKPSQDQRSTRSIFLINAVAAVTLSQYAHTHFSAQGGGIIININSVAGLRGSSHEPVYAASKFGLRGFSESVKDAWWRQGIRMVDVYSGAIGTGMSAHRPDVSELIDPKEVATFLAELCKTESFSTREINFQRTYKSQQGEERIVFANGVFDLLHEGHLELLKFAKSLGTKLVVGINSDRSTEALKGSGRPVHGEQQRKKVLESIDVVDEVVIFNEKRPTTLIRTIKPHVVVKGADHAIADVRKIDMVPNDVEVVTYSIVTDSDGEKISTTKTVERMHQKKGQ